MGKEDYVVGTVKRYLAAVLLAITLFFVVPSLGEGKSYIPCDCLFGRCSCFIQLGDEGGAVKKIIEMLIEKKYLGKKTPKGIFSKDVEKAVKKFQADNDLEETGMMDDDTLTFLIWGMSPEDVDAKIGWSYEDCKTVFLPTDGGKKKHIKPTCSKMEDPRKVSNRNAEMLGFDPCGRCYK